MDFKPLVSVVIDNYNYARFLPDAIESALGQSYPRVEVVVVDDGSTDNSREVISSYGNRVIPVFKENGGHASAFNAGFRASRGEIVIFLDADDMLLPETVEKVVRAWRPGVAKAQYALEHIDADGRRLGVVFPRPASMPNGDMRARIARWGEYPTPPTSGNAFGRQTLERLLPLDESRWPMCADYPLLMLAPFLGEVVSLPEILGLYRRHGGNDSGPDELSLDTVVRRLRDDTAFRGPLSELAQKRGIPIGRAGIPPRAGNLRLRMIVARLRPGALAPGTENRVPLMLRGISTAVREPDAPWRRKLFHAAWFIAMAVAPRAQAERLARRMMIPRYANMSSGEHAQIREGTSP